MPSHRVVECGVGSGEFGVRSGEFGVRSSEFGVRSSEFGVRSGEFGVGSSEWGVRSSEFGVRSAKFGVRSADWSGVSALTTALRLMRSLNPPDPRNPWIRFFSSSGIVFRTAPLPSPDPLLPQRVFISDAVRFAFQNACCFAQHLRYVGCLMHARQQEINKVGYLLSGGDGHTSVVLGRSFIED